MNQAAPPRRLLLPVDGSAGSAVAVQYLAGYARQLGPAIAIVLHVQNMKEEHRGAAGNTAEMAIVRTAQDILDSAGIASSPRTVAGDPAQIIERTATEEHADEIVMGSRGLGQWKSLMAGSVASRVVQEVGLPVTIVGTPSQSASPSAAPGEVHRILLAVDGSRHSLRATEYICRLRETGLPLEVELLTVVGPIPPGYLQEFITREKLDFYYQQEGARALFEAGAALESAGVKYSKHIVAGYVVDKLVHMALSRKCTRIVMGTHGHGPMAGLALGSVAYKAMHLSPVPVTLVK